MADLLQFGQSGSFRWIVEMSAMRAIVDINAVVNDLESISTLSDQNESGIQDVSLIAHQLVDIAAELENVVGQFKL